MDVEAGSDLVPVFCVKSLLRRIPAAPSRGLVIFGFKFGAKSDLVPPSVAGYCRF